VNKVFIVVNFVVSNILLLFWLQKPMTHRPRRTTRLRH